MSSCKNCVTKKNTVAVLNPYVCTRDYDLELHKRLWFGITQKNNIKIDFETFETIFDFVNGFIINAQK